jgi:hypothetical protein
MRYYLYIKSHCEYPDLEDEVEAGTDEEALAYFQKRHGDFVSKHDLAIDNNGKFQELEEKC